MTTTIVRDSVVGDNWIRQMQQQVPIQRVMKDGQPTGDILTGPVRLAFVNLFKLPQPTAQTPNPKFGCAAMFPPGADMTIFYEEYYRAAAQKFANRYDAATGQYAGLHSPFRDQAEKMNFGGFTPGCIFISATSKYKPPVVDPNFNPIVSEDKAYAGVWAILSVNAYPYDDPRKKGVAFGLQNVMIIGDDTQHGGGPKDSREAFGSVKGIQAPIVRPDVSGFGAGQPPARPGGPAPVQQQTWTPPANQAAAPPPPPPAQIADEYDTSWMD